MTIGIYFRQITQVNSVVGVYADFIEGFDVQFRPVLKEYYEEYFGWGRWLYDGNDFKVNQLIFPSTEGIWPWDVNAPDDFTYYIPLLCEPVSQITKQNPANQ